MWLENRSEAKIRALARDTECVMSGADAVPEKLLSPAFSSLVAAGTAAMKSLYDESL